MEVRGLLNVTEQQPVGFYPCDHGFILTIQQYILSLSFWDQSAILSAQSAANVKKESLCQPALEILETSSQESSLESDTDEDDDYMDI